ncbi:MAG TPA: TonB-dependent receptor [Terracidiphilus sp.]|nr:TonB-dependent receptor [Terracidiphilus sp.]
MTSHCRTLARILPLAVILLVPIYSRAQAGAAGPVNGAVTDPSGAVIPGAAITVSNPLSGFSRTAVTDGSGRFQITNVPFSSYTLTASARGFSPLTQSVAVNSAVGVHLNLVLAVAAASSTVTVSSSGPLVQNTSVMQNDISRSMFIKVPVESQSSSLSSLVTMTTPGVTADSNGLFHGLGDHASNSFSIDGQPITDQQSKVFSNQLPTNAIQSIQVIEGAPPAQYGDKTSLVIVATTRSGQGETKPTGSVYSSYGAFGLATSGFNLGYGGSNWGNFLELDGLDTGRFLDPPEFSVFHSKGNEGNAFDRVDYNLTANTSAHLNLNYSRSWFETPDSLDNRNVQNVVAGGSGAAPEFASVGNTDQRSKINTFNIAPSFTHVISNSAVLNVSLFARKDDYDYFPSHNPLADLGPLNLQTSSIAQYRTLTNTGMHADYTYAKGIQNLIAGAEYEQTFLREHDALGIVDSTYNSPCMDATTGNPLPGYASQAGCAGVAAPNPNFTPVLAPYDLTRGGGFYHFFGSGDIKEAAFYIEDQIKTGNWHFSLGLRQDLYKGLTPANQTEPRLGIAYRIAPSGSVVGFSYARTMETPFNENLVLSSTGCSDPVLSPLLNCTPGVSGAVKPGYRNEYHVTLQQPLGKYFVFSGEYIWKYTNNAADFSVLGNTPITFPIEWQKSKIPGYALHLQAPNYHGFSAYTVMSSVAARFFPPQDAGAGATLGAAGLPFRIDHDEKFNQTTHLQYTIPGQTFLSGLWGGINWRYDSGMVAGATPCYNPLSNDPNSACGNTSAMLNGQPAVAMVDNNLPPTVNPVTGANVYVPLTADEEFQAGLMCNGVRATPSQPLPAVCPASEFSSTLIRVPAPGSGDNDRNPPRIAPRDLFDVSVGKSNIFQGDKYKLDFDLTAINVTNKYALYNFLSTFSGTHYVTPRAMSAKVTFNF